MLELLSRIRHLRNFLGGDSDMETPVPIPNTVVKHVTPKILVWRRAGKIGTAEGLFKGRVSFKIRDLFLFNYFLFIF